MEDSQGDAEERDRAALRALGEGNAEAFEPLVRRHWQGLVRYLAARAGGAAAGEDLAQEVFLKVVRAAKEGRGFGGKSTVRTWLFSIAANTAIDHQRARGRRIGFSDEPKPEPPSNDLQPDQEAMAWEEIRRIESWLSQLPDEQAEAVRLRALGGLMVPEIAEATGVSLATAKSRLRYGLTKLKEIVPGRLEVNRD